MIRRLLILLMLIPVFSGAQEIERLKRAVDAAKSDSQKVRLYNELAIAYDNIRDQQSAVYAKKALELAQKTDNLKGEAMAYRVLGYSAESMSHYTEAIGHYQTSFEKFSQLNDTIGMGKALSNMSNSEYFIGDYVSAADHASKAISLYSAVKFYQGVGAASIALGNVYVDQKLYGEAQKKFYDALAAAKHYPDQPSFAARAYASLGNIHTFRKNLDSAAYFYTMAQKVFEAENLPAENSVCLNNLALIYRDQNKSEDAQRLMYKSLRIRESLHDTDGITTCYENLSSIAMEKKDYDSAMYFLRSALYLTTITKSKPQRLTCYQGLADAFGEMGKTDSAYYYLNRYTLLNDTLTGEENINALNLIKERYYSEKQQREFGEAEKNRLAEKARSARNITIMVIALAVLIVISVVIYTRYRAKQKLSDTLAKQNHEITQQKNEITDSITYARRIQESILPPDVTVKNLLPHSFIFYLPKDIVSGDFYWVDEMEGRVIFAAVDCTGHGVPGALMSVVGFNLLNQAVNEKRLTRPSEILQHLDYGVNKLLRQSDSDNTVKDGMDLALCSYDPKTRVLEYAGVFNPLYLVQNGELRVIKADKFPIGLNIDGKVDDFTNHSIQLSPGDMVYIFSDGYADQFGGPSGKKFKYTQLRTLLQSIATLSPQEQHDEVKNKFLGWKGTFEQVDDILLIGMKVQ